MRLPLAVILLTTFSVRLATAGPRDESLMDGEVTIHGSWNPSFSLLFFRRDCPLDIPGTANADTDVFECERTAKAATCKVRSAPVSTVWQVKPPVAQHTILLTITKDTATKLELSTPRSEITISSNLKTGGATLAQNKRRKITCEGHYLTPAAWRAMQQEMRSQEAKQTARDSSDEDRSGATDAPSTDRASSPSSTPARSKPKGLAHGRMCGKDSECESGSCKMENRTRGRCS